MFIQQMHSAKATYLISGKRSRSRSGKGSLTFGVRFNQRDTLNGIMFAQRLLLTCVAVVLITCLLLITHASCKSSVDGPSETVRRESDSSIANSSDQLISVHEQPRQYFKIRAAPNQQQQQAKKRSLNKQQAVRRAITARDTNLQEQQPSKQPKISNATLKKLLNQSLLKPLNGSLTGSGSSKSSNFKFVFIQRATAPPSTGQAALDQAKKGSGKESAAPKQQHQPSLAASVSKQLASSLLSSAANIVANLSSAPSLTSLASQIVAQTLDTHQEEANSIIGSTSTKVNPNKTIFSPPVAAVTIAADDGDSQDIKRIQATADASDKRATKQQQQTSVSNKQGSNKSSTKQPSKIYNLPVKFVANGQPSHLVISTLRQHFATIKRLQAATKGGQQQQGKRRKQQHGQKLKGNSRLIYLPLKYLSNARPNKVITGKVTHKSK